jgi:hypothetical protein
MSRFVRFAAWALLAAACQTAEQQIDAAQPELDAGLVDAGPTTDLDAGVQDAGFVPPTDGAIDAGHDMDSGETDSGSVLEDAGTIDVDASIVADAMPHGPGTLVNDGDVVGIRGITLTALADTLGAPIEVGIEAASAPSEALPTDAMLVGDFFSLRAATDVYVSTDSPIVIRIPVPSGADTAHLALATLSEPDEFRDVELTTRVWQLLDGAYFPSESVFVTTLGALSAAGHTYALVTSAYMDSP